MSDDTIKRLEMKIAQLESAMEKMAATRAPAPAQQLSAEEIAAYRKVRDVIAADYGDFCGINDCFRCIVVRCVQVCRVLCDFRPCDIECTCGPCNIGSLAGGLRRFGNLGS